MSNHRRLVALSITVITLACLARDVQGGITAGPFTNAANGHRYVLLSPAAWFAQQTEAVAMSGQLATVRNAAEQSWLVSTFSPFLGSGSAYIGLTDRAVEGGFAWSSGEASTYRNWASGEPNGGTNENFVELTSASHPAAGKWNDISGEAVRAAIIELGGIGLGAPVFDLSADFSLVANPNGAWSYGHAPSLGALNLFTRSRRSSDGLEVWETPATIPAVLRNGTAAPIGPYPPGAVAFHPGVEGSGINYGVLRLTLPAGLGGSYRVETTVHPLYSGPPQGDTDFHVLHNGIELFGRFLAPSENTAFNAALNLNPGDTVDFAVGRGADGREFGSLLRIFARVTSVVTNPPSITAEPASRTVTVGESASFAVEVAGTPPFQYQWRFNEQEIPGATQPSFSVFNAQPADAGAYQVIVRNAVGVVTSQVARLTVTAAPIPVRVASVTAAAGTEVVVPVELGATGNENALGFSLQFNASLAAFVGADLAPGLPAGASLVVNANQVAAGRVGLAVALAPGMSFPAGTQAVVAVRFAVAAVATTVSIPLAFADEPTASQVSDSLAQGVPATFLPGAIHVLASQVRVVNTTTVSGGEATVRVQLVAQGNENALAFSMNFNSAVLGLLEASRGSGLPAGGSLIVNDAGAGAGRVGVAVALETGRSFPAGTQEVAVLRMMVAPVLAGQTVPIAFGDQPTVRQVADPLARVVPAEFVPGTVTISEVQFEGDAAPRPNGDGAVTLIDFVQLGRFVAGLDMIASPTEFQRVDCAPRAGRGNGLITVSDLVQAGRYTVGADPLTPVGGPDTEGGGGGALGLIPASAVTVSAVDTTIPAGQANEVPVTLLASGTENALSFSVRFDPEVLTFLGAWNGSAMAGASLILNSNQAAFGQVGVVLALPPGQTLASGAAEVARLRFLARGAGTASTELGFGNQPVPQETSDVAAGVVPTSYSSGQVKVVGLPAPSLAISRQGPWLQVSWPASATGFVLESTSLMAGGLWSPVEGVVVVGTQKQAILSAEGERRFFRLRQP